MNCHGKSSSGTKTQSVSNIEDHPNYRKLKGIGTLLSVVPIGGLGTAAERLGIATAERLTAEGITARTVMGEASEAGEGVLRRFFTVQDEANASRLLSGGTPWPTSVTRAHLVEGLYAWGTRSQAKSYLSLLQNNGASGLRILEATIPETRYLSLHSLDLRTLSDDIAGAWLERHSSLFGSGLPHGLEHVIRETGRFGPEYFFSKDVFPLFQLQ